MSSLQLLAPAIESVLQAVIFPDLEKGRKDFDLPHTKAVVFWMKELLTQLNNPELNAKVLITAAYAHDWGYIGLFDGFNSNDPHVIASRKPLHMEHGAKLITDLLTTQLKSEFTQNEVTAVAQLVAVHDLVEQVQTPEEVLIMEADTLGMLDVDKVKPTFSPEENTKFVTNEVYNRRLLYFKDAIALEKAKELAEKRRLFFS